METRVTGVIKALQIPVLPPAKVGHTLDGLVGSKSDKWRPAPGGVSIGHYSISAGTLATRVFDADTGQRLLLSNNHVFAAVNQGKHGDAILQPGYHDGGRIESDTIATLERFVEIKPSPLSNLVDAAVARPLNDGDLSDEVLDLGVFTHIVEPVVGMRIAKSGRTTCYGEAEIIDIFATVKVGMGDWGTALFEDQILTEHLADPGDSGSGTGDVGSMASTPEDKGAVGLVYAGSDTVSALNRLGNVCNLLNVVLRPGDVIPPINTTWGFTALALGSLPLIAVGSVIASKETGVWPEWMR